MHLVGITFFLAYLLHTDLSYCEYSDEDEEEHVDEADSPALPDMEQRLRSASSVDELMRLMYPLYWAALKCRSKLPFAATYKLSHRLSPQTDETTFAAAYLNLDVLKSIESEWRKTQCIPREVCVDVGREFGAPTNIFYKPPCVSVYRCGGCCHSEDKQCRNISTGYLSKSIFEITVPVSQGTKPVTISVANHTQCRCLSKLDMYKHVHSIIRRAVPQCPIANQACAQDEDWSSTRCRCVNTANNQSPSSSLLRSPQELDIFPADVCGPHKELHVETCQCVCQRTDPTPDCGAHRHFDRSACQCVCNTAPTHPCPQNHVYDKETCQCTCSKTCPKHQPLDKTKCSCQCNQSPTKCFLKGRRFHYATCSCIRPPCEVRRRRCEAGFFFSEEVCRCVPSHWRRVD
uniref:vascular endothelial growth factor C isoform X1 n=1 Tax=Doryrhamphus excisus TaxID=161450 RepID=UPI0025AE97D7|nr:vascular endothelial growth factor C isoform X1 [Doryrhamphus excisus]